MLQRRKQSFLYGSQLAYGGLLSLFSDYFNKTEETENLTHMRRVRFSFKTGVVFWLNDFVHVFMQDGHTVIFLDDRLSRRLQILCSYKTLGFMFAESSTYGRIETETELRLH